MVPRLLAVLAIAPVVATPSCCSLARFFCGPDRSPWVSVGFETPTETLRTFLEAIRRDQPATIYRCLAEDWKKQHANLDGMGAQVAWDAIKQQVPGIHLAGYAEVPPPSRETPGLVTFELDVEGHRMVVDLVPQAYWRVVYRHAKGRSTTESYVTSLQPLLQTMTVPDAADPDHHMSRLVAGPLLFDHDPSPTVERGQVERIELGHDWKIARLELPQS